MDTKKEIVKLIQSALFSASKAAYYALKTADDEMLKVRQESGAVDIALCGLSAIQAAKVLYVTAKEESELIEEVFRQYEVFVCEMVTNFTTNHSQQWMLTKKDRLLELVKGTELEVSPAYEE